MFYFTFGLTAVGGWATRSCFGVFLGLAIMSRDDTTSPVPRRVHQRRQAAALHRMRGGWAAQRQGCLPGTTDPPGSTNRRPGGPICCAPTKTFPMASVRRGLGCARVSELCRCDARSQAHIGVLRMGYPPIGASGSQAKPQASSAAERTAKRGPEPCRIVLFGDQKS